MAPNKFEKFIKDCLQDREIKPSGDAWKRISEQLEVTERPKSKKFQWYAVAAVFIGTLFVAGLFLATTESSNHPEIEISDTSKNPDPINKASEFNSEEKSEKDSPVVNEEIGADETVEITSPESPGMASKNLLADSTRKKKMRIEKIKVPVMVSEELIHTKIAEIIAQVEVLENENSVVTDAEIDALLRQAEQEILKEKIFRKDNSVDASALLADVENELDKSFRDQIFDALKDGFVKVRTAVADRNK